MEPYPLTLGAAVTTQLNEALLAQERLPQQTSNQNRTGASIITRTRTRTITKAKPIQNHNQNHGHNRAKHATHTQGGMYVLEAGGGVGGVWWCWWGLVVLV